MPTAFRPVLWTVVLAFCAVQATAQTSSMIVMDGSGSMWGQIGGRTKLEIARETAAEVLGQIPPDRVLGLMAYGHRERGNCADIEVMVPPAAGTAPAILKAVKAMRFQGKTPLTEAVRQAAAALRSTESPATVILVTDGIETCAADPCALATELEATGVDFTAHVIGFGLTRDQGAEVACIAENTGGRYLPASDAASLAEALKQTVSAAPPPAPEAAPPPAPVERSRHFPGHPWMEGFVLGPTGLTFGTPGPAPAPPAFAADGTAQECQALCAAESRCGSWRFEPAAVMMRAGNACFLMHPHVELTATLYPEADGFVSGMKEGVVGLLAPVVLRGGSAPVSLQVPEPVTPGAEFTVLWSGPGEKDDWIDLVVPSHEALSGEISYFYTAETVEEGDQPEGAGTLTAPAAAGPYELRYVLGRTPDRRVIHRQPLTIGGEGPATGSIPSGADRGSGLRILPVEISAAPPHAQDPIQWSATPLDPVPEAPEALALPEALQGPWTAELYPGRWRIEGEATGGQPLWAEILVSGDGGQRFEIPLRGRGTGPGTPAGRALIGVETGLRVTLPDGWEMVEEFFAETAAGVRAQAPSATFKGPQGQILVLNPLQWVAQNGRCRESPIGPLCSVEREEAATVAAIEQLLTSLSLGERPDFGGARFRPEGEDPLSTLVPGWSVR